MKIKETAGYANRKDYTKPDDNAVSFFDALPEEPKEKSLEEMFRDKMGIPDEEAKSLGAKDSSSSNQPVHHSIEEENSEDEPIIETIENEEEAISDDITDVNPLSELPSTLLRELLGAVLTLVAVLSVGIPYFAYVCGRGRGVLVNIACVLAVCIFGTAFVVFALKSYADVRKYLADKNNIG